MSERLRSNLLLGCFGVAVLYLPDCARILASTTASVRGAPIAQSRHGVIASEALARAERRPGTHLSSVPPPPTPEELLGGE